jgi:hypothetical protein
MSLKPNKRRVEKRTIKDVETKIRRQQTRKPFAHNTGASDIIREWDNKKNGWNYFEYYTTRHSKESARAVAKGLRSMGIKSRVRKNNSVIVMNEWHVYQEIDVE